MGGVREGWREGEGEGGVLLADGAAATAACDAYLHDRGIERVEIQKQYELIIKPTLRLEDETTSVCRLLTP